MNLARVGPLPTVVIAIVFGMVFFIFAVVVVLTKVSEKRLKLYSVIFWLYLVLQLYSTYAVQIHHHASGLVRIYSKVIHVYNWQLSFGRWTLQSLLCF